MAFNIGVLAYGSLIQDPGEEITPLITHRIQCVTPFKVEFARSSSTRSNAATLIPVIDAGAFVNAVILVLRDDISIQKTMDMIWRRETRNNDRTQSYVPKKNPTTNTVQVKTLEIFEGVNKVLYTSIGSNMSIVSPAILANMAIDSILDDAGEKGLDGVRYLESAISNGIVTPMTEEFKQNILLQTHAENLAQAIDILDKKRPQYIKKKAKALAFEQKVVELTNLICEYGQKTTIGKLKLTQDEFFDYAQKNRQLFIKNCHDGFKKAQIEIVQIMLEIEAEADNLSLEMKKAVANKSKVLVNDIKKDLATIENKEHILRHLIDSIAWHMIKGQLYIARRLYNGVKGRKRLQRSNIESTLIAAEKINKNPFEFALITDLSAYIQAGDMLVAKEDGALTFVEVKEGAKNRQILDIIEKLTTSNKPIPELFSNLKMDKKSLDQLDRNLKQLSHMINLTTILNNDEGLDKTGKKVRIYTPNEDTPRFYEQLHALEQQLEKTGLWAYNVIDECLHIGLYKGYMKPVGEMMLEGIGKKKSENIIIVNQRSVIRSLNKPIFFLPFSKEFIFDILFGRIELLFMLDIDKYLTLFQEFGLEARWLNRKDTMKLMENRKNDNPIFVHKNRAIEITDLSSGTKSQIATGLFNKMYFEHIYPSYTAYSLTYFSKEMTATDLN